MRIRQIGMILSAGLILAAAGIGAQAQSFGYPGYNGTWGMGGVIILPDFLYGPPLILGTGGIQPAFGTGAPFNGYSYGNYWFNGGYFPNGGWDYAQNPYNGYRDNPGDSGRYVSAGNSSEDTFAVGSGDIPRTDDHIQARKDKDGGISIEWQGGPRLVSRIVFMLLDAKGKTLRQRTIIEPPASIRFPRTDASASYEVRIEYINGTTNTIASSI